MRINPQRAAYAAVKLAIISYAIFYPGLGQAQQDETSKTLEKVMVSTGWLGSPTPEAATKNSRARSVITSQELTESGMRGLNPLRREVSQ